MHRSRTPLMEDGIQVKRRTPSKKSLSKHFTFKPKSLFINSGDKTKLPKLDCLNENWWLIIFVNIQFCSPVYFTSGSTRHSHYTFLFDNFYILQNFFCKTYLDYKCWWWRFNETHLNGLAKKTKQQLISIVDSISNIPFPQQLLCLKIQVIYLDWFPI